MAIDHGINYIDTAECYGNCEEMIGDILHTRQNECFVFTKCGHAQDLPGENWSISTLELSVDRSLKRLRRDQLDLLALHSCPLEILQRGEVLEFLGRMKKKGKVKYIGCSADGEAALYAMKSYPIDVLQCTINFIDQQAIAKLLPVTKELGLGVLAKRPIANAIWTSKDKPSDPWLLPYWDRWQQVNFKPEEYGCVSITELAIRFLLTLDSLHGVLLGVTKIEHLIENIAHLSAGPLEDESFLKIKERWLEISGGTWYARG